MLEICTKINSLDALIYIVLNNYSFSKTLITHIEVPAASWRDSDIQILQYFGDICDKHSICRDCELFTRHIRDFCYIRLVLRC